MGFFQSKTFLVIAGILAVLIVFGIFVPFFLNAVGVNRFSFAAVGLAGSGGSAITRSSDQGETWKTVFPPTDSRGRRASVRITDFEYHPLNSSEIFVATDDAGLWRSKDSGTTWESIVDRDGFLTPESRVYAVAYSKSAPFILYVSLVTNGENIVVSSSDNGTRVKEIYRVTANGGIVRAIAIDPADAQTMYFGASDGSLFETTNAGFTWRVINRFSGSIRGIFMSSASGTDFLVFMESGEVNRTADRGTTWNTISFSPPSDSTRRTIMGIPQPGEDPLLVENPFESPFSLFSGSEAYDIAVDPHTLSLITAITKDGIIRTFDGGRTWESIDTLVEPDDESRGTAATVPANNSTIVFALGSDFYRSNDNGRTWRKVLLASPMRKLVTHPDDPSVLFGIME